MLYWTGILSFWPLFLLFPSFFLFPFFPLPLPPSSPSPLPPLLQRCADQVSQFARAAAQRPCLLSECRDLSVVLGLRPPPVHAQTGTPPGGCGIHLLVAVVSTHTRGYKHAFIYVPSSPPPSHVHRCRSQCGDCWFKRGGLHSFSSV